MRTLPRGSWLVGPFCRDAAAATPATAVDRPARATRKGRTLPAAADAVAASASSGISSSAAAVLARVMATAKFSSSRKR